MSSMTAPQASPVTQGQAALQYEIDRIREAKHTPGPWSVHSGMRDCVTFKGRHGMENLFLANLDGYYACQNEADARLIAAAPDLLKALKVALPALVLFQSVADSTGISPHLPGLSGIMKQMLAAVEKATGATR